MSISVIGASSVEKDVTDCIIRKIICERKKEKPVVLYDRDKVSGRCPVKFDKSGRFINDHTVEGGISNFTEPSEFYVVTDYEGLEVELKCVREENCCFENKHRTYDIDYIDIETKDIKSISRDISNQNYRFQYFDLFNRGLRYAKTAAIYTNNQLKAAGIYNVVDRVGQPLVASATGLVVGDVLDYFASLRFVFLPEISSTDNDYECHAAILYHECPHFPSVPDLFVHIYPSIVYKLKIGFFGAEKKVSANLDTRDKTTITPFEFEFTANYANYTANLKYGKKITETNTKREQREALFFKAVNAFGEFLRKSAGMTKELIQQFDSNVPQTANVRADLTNVMRATGALGNMIIKPDWIAGSLEVKPSISAKWNYDTSDDLRNLKRYFEIAIGISLSGKLTIDLIKLAWFVYKKAKNVSNVAVATVSVASGGIAAAPAIVVKFLIETVVSYFLKELSEGAKLDLILSADLNSTPITFKNKKDSVIENFERGFDIKIQIQLLAKLGIKGSISPVVYLKVEGELGVSGSATASIFWDFKFNVRDKVPGIDQNIVINPLTIKLEFVAAGSYQIWIFKSSREKKKTKEWKFKEKKYDLDRLEFFKLNDDDAKVSKTSSKKE